MARRWKEQVWYASRSQRPEKPFEKAIVRYVRYCGHIEPDQDNLASGFKWIQDGLVEAGFFVDDSMSHLEAYYEWEPSNPKNKRVTIEIVPVLPECSPEPTRKDGE